MALHDHPFPGNATRRAVLIVDDYDEIGSRPIEADLDHANILTSEYAVEGMGGWHRPVLDIDFPATLVESSTPGKYHLYLDGLLTWDEYRRVLEVLGEVGILEQGYVSASIDRGYTAVRLPWVKKGDAVPPATPAVILEDE